MTRAVPRSPLACLWACLWLAAACGDNAAGPAPDGAVVDGAVADGALADGPAGDGLSIVDAAPGVDACPAPCPPPGRWTAGDLHVHSIQSNDAQTPLREVLAAAFDRHDLDWIALSNHLRMSDRDPDGAALPGGPIAFSRALAAYEVPLIAGLQAAGTYADRIAFSSVEWDMPTHEHVNIGILADVAAMSEFEYRFTSREPSRFDAADVERWGTDRAFTTHDDALRAIAWLKEHHADTSYALISHPTRYPDRYRIADLRALNDLAPAIVFGIEGMVGNQMEPDRGGYASPYIEANAHARTYGGADSVIARVGGVWDALLGEGRRIWSFGSSDFHFKTAQGRFSSGYFPGEYTRTYVWVDGDGMPAVLAGLRSGKSFAVNGNLISALDFTVAADGVADQGMGGELRVARGTRVRITIRFRRDLPSNYETSVGSGDRPGAIPVLDHIDLIAGDVGARALPGTPGYDQASNPSARVAARFTAATWTRDPAGYDVVTHEIVVDRDQYLRLRGTNLALDVPGETANGEPLADAKVDIADHQARFDAINDRNYADLWFYSNPIFIAVD
jgi:hypothetical protein